MGFFNESYGLRISPSAVPIDTPTFCDNSPWETDLVMRIILRTAVRDIVPETITEGYRRARIVRDPQEINADIWMHREVEWDAVPRQGDEFDPANGSRPFSP